MWGTVLSRDRPPGIVDERRAESLSGTLRFLGLFFGAPCVILLLGKTFYLGPPLPRPWWHIAQVARNLP